MDTDFPLATAGLPCPHIWVSFIRPPLNISLVADLHLYLLFVFPSLFAIHRSMHSVHRTRGIFNFFPLLPLFIVTQKNLSFAMLFSLSLPVLLLEVHTFTCVYACLRAHTCLYSLIACLYLPLSSKKEGQRFEVKCNKDLEPSISRAFKSAQKIVFKFVMKISICPFILHYFNQLSLEH